MPFNAVCRNRYNADLGRFFHHALRQSTFAMRSPRISVQIADSASNVNPCNVSPSTGLSTEQLTFFRTIRCVDDGVFPPAEIGAISFICMNSATARSWALISILSPAADSGQDDHDDEQLADRCFQGNVRRRRASDHCHGIACSLVGISHSQY